MASLKSSGRLSYRLRSILVLLWASFSVAVRRVFKGPLLPNWSWAIEATTRFLKIQIATAIDMPNIEDGREYQDALIFESPALSQVNIEAVIVKSVKGHWFIPKERLENTTLLYLHGGGYSYYSKGQWNLIALVALAAKSRTFALDYRLTPEHPFPAQLDDAKAAYRWLLEKGTEPERLVLIGDSAGGNLVLSLSISLRDAQLPIPALAVCICPWTDVENSGSSIIVNGKYDWIEKRMADTWARWLCKDAEPVHPLISPINADLRGLPPIYIQSGSAEILHDMIVAFAERGKKQGANIVLDVWENMNHDFPAFGAVLPQSKDALERIGKAVDRHARQV